MAFGLTQRYWSSDWRFSQCCRSVVGTVPQLCNAVVSVSVCIYLDTLCYIHQLCHVTSAGVDNTRHPVIVNILHSIGFILTLFTRLSVFTRDSIYVYAIARICYGNSACLSVRQSVCHTGGSVKNG